MLPAVGQGALAVEIQETQACKGPIVAELIQCLNHPATWTACTAERAFLARLEGGCQVPIGASTHLTEDGRLCIEGVVLSLDGSAFLREKLSAADDETPAALGRRLADVLLAAGAGELLKRADA
jgi:hydroxymethylbilane synthase